LKERFPKWQGYFVPRIVWEKEKAYRRARRLVMDRRRQST
jgi:hypothetical protein